MLFYEEINRKNGIQIYQPFSNIQKTYELPNSYYINPKGFLFNCFGDDGHKEANLMYTYELVKDSFYNKKYISLSDDGSISLKKILKSELLNYKRIMDSKELTRSDVKKYLNMNCLNLSDSLLVKLVMGIISSKIIFLEKFIELESLSDNKEEVINKIIRESNDDINDILIRLCGFHKIESQIDKTITTSSLNLNNFREYLDRGFNICVIPKILLNEEYDEFYETILIDRFLDKNPEYNDKIYTKRLVINKCGNTHE